MGQMKAIFNMLEHGFSDDKIAWYLLMNTKVSNWEQAKKVANEMRNDYEENKKDNENGRAIE
tara:strand:- start:72 stop:257 length:186 start_codon:yes stop_codon:yes gene_type:complete